MSKTNGQIDIGPMGLVTPESVEQLRQKNVKKMKEREARAALFPSDEQIEMRLRELYSHVDEETMAEIIRLQLSQKRDVIRAGYHYANLYSEIVPYPPGDPQ